MKLPENFIERMTELLGKGEFQEFLESYDKDRFYGLRVNTLKISVEEFLKISPFELKKIPWTKDGFYYSSSVNPGKHPFYYMGLYYIQEPSAMLPATIIDAKPGEKVLDLCAAPGGKTVQVAAAMMGQGLLISNDISAGRIKTLIKNVEYFGIKNCVVTNENPENLAKKFEGYFDRILVDAPCSGEGMFRKDSEAIKSYNNFNPQKCAGMQNDILHCVDSMLKDGGYIVYSTCTFNPDENERMIVDFCSKYAYEIVEIPKGNGVYSGRADWANDYEEISKAARIWPHKADGEGHFAALIRKLESGKKISGLPINNTELNEQHELLYRNFEKENLNISLSGNLFSRGKHLYFLPDDVPDFRNLRISKYGLFLGEINEKLDEFEPSHSLLISLNKSDLKNTVTVGLDSLYLKKYLFGETVIFDGGVEINITSTLTKNRVALCAGNLTVGWGKLSEDTLKNLYPKGWRIL